MDGLKLVKMANEIAAFWASDPDKGAALEGLVGHIRRFWEPRMRRELVAWVDAQGNAALHPLVREAFHARRKDLLPTA
jgi:formate dehydrogenase subunit delta